MKKITKKEFINALINNKSLHVGIFRKDFTTDEINTALSDTMDNFDVFAEELRTAEKYSKGLRFSNNSILDINNTEHEINECFMHNLKNNFVCYQVRSEWVSDDFNENRKRIKIKKFQNLYYLVKK